MDSTQLSKDTIWQTGLKKKIQKICCVQETHFFDRNNHQLRGKGWMEIYQANGPPKHAGVAILLSDKVDFNLYWSTEMRKDISC
jgi:exonuclease III